MRIRSAFLLALAVPLRLLAQEPAERAQTQAAPEWSVSVGAMAFAFPSYPGSDEYRVVPFPLVDARFRDRVYLGPSSTGIGFALGAYPIQSSRWRLAVELGGQDSRPADARGCARGHGGPRPRRDRGREPELSQLDPSRASSPCPRD